MIGVSDAATLPYTDTQTTLTCCVVTGGDTSEEKLATGPAVLLAVFSFLDVIEECKAFDTQVLGNKSKFKFLCVCGFLLGL